MTNERFSSIFFTSRDGLKLHVRHYPAPGSKLRPVLCLPGLTRNGRDFDALALRLSEPGEGARDVFCFDYRGRGLSEHDPNWRNYAVPIEMLDVLDFLTMRGLHDVAIVGTSRGGLIAMVMAAAQPAAIGSIVLNDIGPVIERAGLTRIAGYVGMVPLPRSWADAARIVADLNARHFPNVNEETWERVAKQWFNEKNGAPAPGYDAQLKQTLSILDGPVPELWPQFAALKRVPVLVLRGENSDILSGQTVDEMRRRHPSVDTFVVPDQGHAPLLMDEGSLDSIAGFLDESEAASVPKGVYARA